MNRSDSEKIAARLEDSGYQPAPTAEKSDLVVINFCSVRQGAVHRALDQAHKLALRNKKIVAAGCVLPQDKKMLAAKNIEFWHPDEYFPSRPLRHNRFSAFVPIMTGCDNFCSYCAVPLTRGREKSRPAEAILAEIKKALRDGSQEIILLGQNVNSYKSPNPGRRAPGADFPSLLKKIDRLPGKFWLSFISSHPKDMSPELIRVFAQSKKIIPYLHLPVQSGDDRILRAMNRRYTTKHYKTLLKKIRLAWVKERGAWPPLAISTDVIVGFPGETKKQFQNTLKLIREEKFDMVYFARYSPRSGTAAARLKDNVPPQEKRRRAGLINGQLKKNSLAINKKYLNQKIEVLIEQAGHGSASGRTATNKNILLPKSGLRSGRIVAARITGVSAWGLSGEAVKDCPQEVFKPGKCG